MNRKQVKRSRPRCNVVGCVGWSYKGDCRCIKHILMKYQGVWNHSLHESGQRNMPYTLDRYEQ